VKIKLKFITVLFCVLFFGLKTQAQNDVVLINPDQYVKCFSNPTFHFTNGTIKQCDTIGANAVRHEYWNFGDHWNLGYDSIINWTAWFSPNQYSITYTAPGNYNVVLIDSSSCGKDSTSLTITLINNPIAGLNVVNPSACKNSSVSITNTSTSGYSYQLNSGADANYLPAVLGNNSLQFDTAGTFNISLVAFFIGADTSCFDTAKVSISILELPQTSFTYTLSSNCDNATALFTDASVNVISWNWNFGNGNTANTQIVALQNYSSGAYPVTLSVTGANNCQNTFTDTITIYTSPIANFGSNNVCLNSVTSFTDQSTLNGLGSIQQWNWDFGDGTTSSLQNPVHQFNAAGTYQVKLKINSLFCSDSILQNVEIYPLPTPNFSFTPGSGCSPLVVDFTNTSTGAIAYNWNFGDGSNSNGSNPSHVYQSNISDTIFTSLLIAENNFGCKDSISNTINISGKPVANFTVLNDTVCSGSSVVFTNLSLGYSNSFWELGNGNTSTQNSPILIYSSTSATQSQLNQIRLIVENTATCKDTFELNLIILPIVNADFSVDTLFCSNETAQFTNTSTGATTYQWSFGDGNSSLLANPSHDFQNFGTGQLPYPVKLVASSNFGCKDSLIKTCYVLAGPEASFVATPQIQTYPASTINLFNSTVNAALYSINWNFGDNQTSTSAFPNNHTYSTWGNYIITLSVVNGQCTDVFKDTISILPPLPIAAFNGKKEGCRPLAVNFNNTSQYESSYLWKFGDGQTSSNENPTHIYTEAGTYDVVLIVTGVGGTDSIIGTDSIVVFDKPTALFSVSPTEVNVETEPIVITNQSTCTDGTITSYYYNFGDNSSSTQANPAHTYKKSGDYEVYLIATSSKGCKDTFEFGQFIKVDETISIVIPNAFTPNSQSANAFGFYDPYATNNDIFHPVVKGMKEFELSIYSRWGELLFESKDPKSGWDGYFNGKLCQQDVYIWKIKAKGKDDSEYNKTGDFLLIR
jgi:gliding motility-associated-like protein